MKNYFVLTAAVCLLSLNLNAKAQNASKPLPAGTTVVQLNPADSSALASSLKDGLLIEKDIQIQTMQNAEKRKEWQDGFRAAVEKVRVANHFGSDVTYDFTNFQFVKTAPAKKLQSKTAYPVPVNLGQNRPSAVVKYKK